MRTAITKESLLKFGMCMVDSPNVTMQKKLDTDGDEEIFISITRFRNCNELSLVINGVGLLYLKATCIEDLEALERLRPEFDSFV